MAHKVMNQERRTVCRSCKSLTIPDVVGRHDEPMICFELSMPSMDEKLQQSDVCIEHMNDAS